MNINMNTKSLFTVVASSDVDLTGVTWLQVPSSVIHCSHNDDIIVNKFVYDIVTKPIGGYLAALDKDFDDWVNVYRTTYNSFKSVDNFFTDQAFLQSCDQLIFADSSSLDYSKRFIMKCIVDFYWINISCGERPPPVVAISDVESVLARVFDTDEGFKKKIELYASLVQTRKHRLTLLRDYMGDYM